MSSSLVVVILGATGTGKTKLSVDIARRINGEIINADAMQVYAGLNILTNKANEVERCGIRHHMLATAMPWKTISVIDFVSQAQNAIADITSRGATPVIVGGTGYYIEALLFQHQLIGKTKSIKDDINAENDISLTLADDQLHAALVSVDPVTAMKLHPHDVRKLRRALSIYYTTGISQSEHQRRQRFNQENDFVGELNHVLRYPNVLALWVDSEPEVLDIRLDRRVDSMVASGLLSELREFFMELRSHRDDGSLDMKLLRDGNDSSAGWNFENGCLQSIGVAQLYKYISSVSSNSTADVYSTDVTLAEGIENMKTQTRRYSRRQVKWIVKRFIGYSQKNVEKPGLVVVPVNSTFPECWETDVLAPAMAVVASAFKHGVTADAFTSPLPYLPFRKDLFDATILQAKQRLQPWNKFPCDICPDNLVLNGHVEWTVHLRSKRHRAAKRKVKKKHEGSKQECSKQ